MMFMTKQEIIDDLLLYRLNETIKQAIRVLEKNNLLRLHESLGKYIRNEYDFWDSNNPLTVLNYTPQLVDGVDYNPKHPDAVSFEIITRLWEILH